MYADRDRDRDRGDRDRDRRRDDRWEHDKFDSRKRRSRSRSRSRSPGRDRKRSGRDRHRDEDYDSRYEDYESGWQGGGGGGGGQQRMAHDPGVPSNSLIFKGIEKHITEDMLTLALGPHAQVVNARVIRDKVTGESRGFAFVDFPSIEVAKYIYDSYGGRFQIGNKEAVLAYGWEKGSGPPGSNSAGFANRDWMCSACGARNFARRFQCFQCMAERQSNAVLVQAPVAAGGAGPIEPSDVLVVKGLNPQTSEETVRGAFAAFAQVKDIRMIRDRTTGLNRGFCFVEFVSVEASKTAKRMAEQYQLALDGAPLRITFERKDWGPAPPPELAHLTPEQARWVMQQQKAGHDMSAYHAPTTPAPIAMQAMPPAPTNPNAPPVDATTPEGRARYLPDATSGYYYDAVTGLYADLARGLYYNAATGVWCYWDPTHRAYLPYTAPAQATAEQTPGAAPTADGGVAAATAAAAAAANGSSPEAKPAVPSTPTAIAPAKDRTRVSVAFQPKKTGLAAAAAAAAAAVTAPLGAKSKKVDENMAKWKERQQEARAEPAPAAAAPGAAAGHHPHIAHMSSANSAPVGAPSLAVPAAGPSHSPAALPAHGLATSPLPPDAAAAAAYVPSEADVAAFSRACLDMANLICTLCKRKLGSAEVLLAHEAKSDLHKKSLEEARARGLIGPAGAPHQTQPHQAAPAPAPTGGEHGHQYRDRAAELRAIWGPGRHNEELDKRAVSSGAAPAQHGHGHGASRSPQPAAAVPTAVALNTKLDASNKGHQMMASMGWQGAGLGKAGDGAVDPVGISMRAERAGLGAESAESAAWAGSYAETTRQAYRKRFEQVFSEGAGPGAQ
eukprot:tig00000769_g3997.t1